MLDLHHAVERVYELYDLLTLKGETPELIFLPDINAGVASPPGRAWKPGSERQGFRADELGEKYHVEGHAAIGAITLASAFGGGIGEPPVRLVGHGGPHSLWLLQSALAGWETGFGIPARARPPDFVRALPDPKLIYSGRILRCATALYQDAHDRYIRIFDDLGNTVRRGMADPPETVQPPLEACVGDLGAMLHDAEAVALVDVNDAWVDQVASQNSLRSASLVLIDTEAYGEQERNKKIRERIGSLAETLPRPIISISSADLLQLAHPNQACRKTKPEPAKAVELALTLSGELGAPVLLHCSKYAAYLGDAGEPHVVPAFRAKVAAGTNGAGDAFNAAFLAAAAARNRAASLGDGASGLDFSECLAFACAVSGARIEAGCYCRREQILDFAYRVRLHSPPHIPGSPSRRPTCAHGARPADPAATPLPGPRRGTPELRRVVFLDLDHTLFPSKEAREEAGARALYAIQPTRDLDHDGRIQLFRTVYALEAQLRAAARLDCASFRLEWNQEDFYRCAVALMSEPLRDRWEGGAPDGALAADSVAPFQGAYKRAKGQLRDQVRECVHAFTEAGYVPYPGVRGAIAALAATPGVEVYCMVEGRIKCQWKKLRILGLSDIIPRSRLLVEDRMIVAGRGFDEAAFDVGPYYVDGKVPDVVRDHVAALQTAYAAMVEDTQRHFRVRYLAAIALDPSAPGYVVEEKNGRLGPNVQIIADRPIQVAIVGDRPDPELAWFSQAVEAENLRGCMCGPPPTAALYRVQTGAYARNRARRLPGMRSAKHVAEAAAKLATDAAWEQVRPLTVVQVPALKPPREAEAAARFVQKQKKELQFAPITEIAEEVIKACRT